MWRRIFNYGITEVLGLKEVYALVGCSLGGGIAWEMAVLAPALFEQLVIIAADWKATDWIIGNCLLQEQILKNSNNPLHDARLHAMLCYRTPQSLKMKFDRSTHLPHTALQRRELATAPRRRSYKSASHSPLTS